MVDLAAATAFIAAISSAVKLVDSVYDTWSKFTREGSIERSSQREFYEKIEASGDDSALIHSTNGNVRKTVTREELAKNLDKNELMVLKALEKRMDQLVAQWSAITEQFETLTPVQQGVSKIQLKDICNELSNCLGQVMTMLENLGFVLGDHYGAVKMIASTRG